MIRKSLQRSVCVLVGTLASTFARAGWAYDRLEGHCCCTPFTNCNTANPSSTNPACHAGETAGETITYEIFGNECGDGLQCLGVGCLIEAADPTCVAKIKPNSVPEIAANGIDDDCDGVVDETVTVTQNGCCCQDASGDCVAPARLDLANPLCKAGQTARAVFVCPSAPTGCACSGVGVPAGSCVPNIPAGDPVCIDSDGDGLTDDWEINGADTDGDPLHDKDLPLPAMGADPNHKDLFVEYDWVASAAPTRVSLQAVKQAFAQAPVNAGGVPNPDGLPGIHLWIDTGALVDQTARENGGGFGSCVDGIDNDGDGNTDGADTDCLAGDNLGGGNQLPGNPVICDMLDKGGAYYTAKAGNFVQNRKGVFRYAIKAPPIKAPLCPGEPIGGRGEYGGNDFVIFNEDGAARPDLHPGSSFMHELGHNLGLDHGGGQRRAMSVNGEEFVNCKPNYVSIMNYDLAFGIPQVGGGLIIDFSPPRFPGGRGAAPLAHLNEETLNENVIMDATDPTNRFIFLPPRPAPDTNMPWVKVQAPLNAFPNWNNDVDPPREPSVRVNINGAAINAAGKAFPAACNTEDIEKDLTGSDDWSHIVLPFGRFKESADGPVNPVMDHEPNDDELQRQHIAVNTTDLAVSKQVLTSAPVAGGLLLYAVAVVNNGPNPASHVVVTDILPADVTFVDAGPGCGEASPGVVICELGELLAQTSRTFEVKVSVAADLVHRANGPITLSNRIQSENLDGPDPVDSNNLAEVTTGILASADLGLSNVSIDPATRILIGGTRKLTLHQALTNLGPSSPMNTRLAFTGTVVSGPAGSVTPDLPSLLESAVAASPRSIDSPYRLACHAPGTIRYSLTGQVSPAAPADLDPEPANNVAKRDLDLTCVLPVRCDLEPGAPHHPVDAHGKVKLAVLTTDAGEHGLPLSFDALAIDPSSVRFGPRRLIFEGSGGATPEGGKGKRENVKGRRHSRERDLDLVFRFNLRESGLLRGDTEACVTGRLKGPAGAGTPFFGCDSIRIK